MDTESKEWFGLWAWTDFPTFWSCYWMPWLYSISPSGCLMGKEHLVPSLSDVFHNLKEFLQCIEWDLLGRQGRISKSVDYLSNKGILPWAFSFGIQSWSILTSYSKLINPSINLRESVSAWCMWLSLWRIKTSDEALNLLIFSPVRLVMVHPARSIWCISLRKGERVVALGVLVSSFHVDATTEAKRRFAEGTSIKPAGHPQYTDKEGLVTGTSQGQL